MREKREKEWKRVIDRVGRRSGMGGKWRRL